VSESDIEDDDSELLLVRRVIPLSTVDNAADETREDIDAIAFNCGLWIDSVATRGRRGVCNVISKSSSSSPPSLSTAMLSSSLLLSF
jgi:hypothetical protein